VNVSEGTNEFTEMLRTCDAESKRASVTRTVKVLVPTAVGVPEIFPVSPEMVSPEGIVPELTDHLYGGVPPTADNVAL
jgi:hypothetical protein